MSKHSTSKRRLVRLAIAETEMQARMWEEILAGHGITALVKNLDAVSTVYGSAPLLPYSYELYVLATDEPRARYILGL